MESCVCVFKRVLLPLFVCVCVCVVGAQEGEW
jgi:hypothetical protein